MCVGERRTASPAIRWSPALSARRARANLIVGRVGKCLVAELDLCPRASLCAWELEPYVGALDAGRHLLEQLPKPRHRMLDVACEAAQARRAEAPLARQRGVAPGSAWRPAQRARLPPRTRHGRPPAQRRRLGWTQRERLDTQPRAPGGGRVPRHPRPLPRAPDGRRGVSRPGLAHRTIEASNGCVKRTCEPSSSTMPSVRPPPAPLVHAHGLHAPR